MRGRQVSHDRLYLKVEVWGRELMSMKKVQEDTKVRVTCDMAYQNSPWIEAAWESEAAKDEKSVCRNANAIPDMYMQGRNV